MKQANLSFKKQLLLFLGITVFSAPTFLRAEEQEEMTIEKRIQELRRRQIDPAIIVKRLAAGVQDISKKIDLSPEEQKRIQEQMKKLKALVAEKKGPDKYTQSEAHLSLRHIRELITRTYNIEPYLNIISSCIAKEGELKKSHYVFYHALANVWRVPQDLYRKLYERLNPLTKKIEDFEFLRWKPSGDLKVSAQKFVVDQLVNYGLINDNHPDTAAILLSANLAIFGNVGFAGESTWEYFMTPKSHFKPKPENFKEILDIFGATDEYIDQLRQLSDILYTKEQTLMQIFIPKEIVDYVAYIAFLQGIPADKQTIDWVLEHIPRKLQRRKIFTPYEKPLKRIRTIFKTEQDRFPLFKELHERAQEGDFSVSALLEIYRNTPRKIDNINYIQARLVFTKDVLMTPGIGIKYFRYDTISREKMREYNQKLDEIVDQIIQERLSRAKAETK